MNRNFKTFGFMVIFSFCVFLSNLNAVQEIPFMWPQVSISMDFKDASLKDILKIFSIQSGLNFIASESVQDRQITLYLDKVPVEEVMDKIFKANNLSYELEQDSNIFIVKDWGKPQLETITKVFYLKYATVSSSSLKEEMANQISATASQAGAGTTGSSASGAAGATGAGGAGTGKWAIEADTGITKAVKKVLSEYGSIVEDFRTNSLIVTDMLSRMSIIAQTITALDMPVPQVMLEVEMLDVNKNKVDKIGFKFGQTPMTMVLTGAKQTGTLWPFRDTSKPVSSPPGITTGNIDFSTASYTVLLDFLKTQADTKYLARPKILTLNNETAEIKIATDEMIGTVTITTTAEGTATTSAEAERVETGVTLRVTPQVNLDAGEITMFLVPTVRDTSTSTLNTSFKDPEVRSTKSTVRVKDGETVIIGGLIRNDSSQTITKLPILGDIPIFGALFRHKNRDKDRERELLVFITPHIVKDTDIKLTQAKKVSLPEREQNTVSGIDRQAVISANLDRLEKK